MKKQLSLYVVIGIVVILLIGAIIGTVVKNRKVAEETTVTETGIAIPVEVTLKNDFDELFADRNVDETRIRILVKDGSNPALRSEPRISDETRLGSIEAGQSFYVKKAYTAQDEDGKAWIGLKFSDMSLSSKYKLEKTIRQEKIIWVRGDYMTAKLIDHDPGSSGGNTPEKDYYVRYTGGRFRVDIEECKLRSAPDSTDDSNIYGDYSGTSTGVFTNIVYENNVNTFYGIPAESVNNYWLRNRVGDVSSDPDGIVWVSAKYAKVVKL